MRQEALMGVDLGPHEHLRLEACFGPGWHRPRAQASGTDRCPEGPWPATRGLPVTRKASNSDTSDTFE